MGKQSPTTNTLLRITIADLPVRTAQSTEAHLAQILKRLAGQEGAPCLRNCDCGIGLVCRQQVCTSDW